jgi:hypothetical protein
MCNLVMQVLATRVTKAKSYHRWSRVWERWWVSRDAPWESKQILGTRVTKAKSHHRWGRVWVDGRLEGCRHHWVETITSNCNPWNKRADRTGSTFTCLCSCLTAFGLALRGVEVVARLLIKVLYQRPLDLISHLFPTGFSLVKANRDSVLGHHVACVRVLMQPA